MSYRIGIDIGTTSTKAVIYGENLERLAAANVGYRIYQDKPGYAEQDPHEILNAFKLAVHMVLEQVGEKRKDVALISFSGAMHSLILVDDMGRPLTRSIIWSDNRSVPEVEEFRNKEDWLSHYKNTGTPIHSMSPFFKLRWLKNHTDLLDRTYKAIGIKEFIIHELTGVYMMDYSTASATGMFNIHELAWDRYALKYLELPEEILPMAEDVQTCLSITSDRFISEMGLPEDLLIMIGASDGCLANLGSDAMDTGETTITIGTSGAVRMTVDKPLLDDEGMTFCYYLSKDRWVIGGSVNNGGNILKWFDGIFYDGKGEVYEDLTENIGKISPGSDGLLFIPYLNGERAPYWDGRLSAAYVGMTGYHEKAHFVRATIEGITFNLKDVWKRLEKLGGKTKVLIASGGFLENEAWKSILADVFGIDYLVVDALDSSCLGAVLLDSVLTDRPDAKVNFAKMTYDPKRRDDYARHYDRYIWYSEKMVALQKESWKNFE